ncbi:FAD:protein FMN transferase [Niveibacterium sp. SC-1]|uniref:FAD:protein FMN transferase n=1 Tax=Niveibacterium sp. SC-1 TaxID=3135646 RepID=UPI00311DF36B
MRPALGCYVEIGVDAGAAEAALAQAFAVIGEIHERMSFQSPDSALSRLNRAGGARVRLDRRTLQVLRLAKTIGAASEGRFNCTVGGELIARGALPSLSTTVLGRGDHRDIVIDGESARLARPVAITLDGIAKGFAVDCAVRALQRAGARGGWVNAGGDLRVFGACALPVSARDTAGGLRPLGCLSHGALASSWVGGDMPAAQAFPAFIAGACDADAGEVFQVVARHAWRADALTKVAACTPRAQRAALVARLGAYLLESGPLPTMSSAPQ